MSILRETAGEESGCALSLLKAAPWPVSTEKCVVRGLYILLFGTEMTKNIFRN